MRRDELIEGKARTSGEGSLMPTADDLPALLPALLLAASLTAALALAGCGRVASSSRVGSETHFLSPCTGECSQGLECLAGVCTVPCGGDAECAPLDPAAACRASRTAQPDSCQVTCASDEQCSTRDAGWACDEGRCV